MFVQQKLSKKVVYLAVWAFTCIAMISPAKAADSFTFSYGAGISAGAYVANVTMQHDTLVAPDGRISVRTTILSVKANPGWTYKIVKSGGINAPVEIDFQKGTCNAKFKLSYKPGSTVLDAGLVRCK